tara:strand:- start:947 stop:1252 length:306 start_codon:yes stop_codon:yes gene_type:complete
MNNFKKVLKILIRSSRFNFLKMELYVKILTTRLINKGTKNKLMESIGILSFSISLKIFNNPFSIISGLRLNRVLKKRIFQTKFRTIKKVFVSNFILLKILY